MTLYLEGLESISTSSTGSAISATNFQPNHLETPRYGCHGLSIGVGTFLVDPADVGSSADWRGRMWLEDCTADPAFSFVDTTELPPRRSAVSSTGLSAMATGTPRSRPAYASTSSDGEICVRLTATSIPTRKRRQIAWPTY